MNLTPEPLEKFQRQLEEGYDIVLEDLSTLSPDEKSEHLYWKAWRSANLSAPSGSVSTNESI